VFAEIIIESGNADADADDLAAWLAAADLSVSVRSNITHDEGARAVYVTILDAGYVASALARWRLTHQKVGLRVTGGAGEVFILQSGEKLEARIVESYLARVRYASVRSVDDVDFISYPDPLQAAESDDVGLVKWGVVRPIRNPSARWDTSIYISDESSHKTVEMAVARMLRKAGLHVAYREPPVYGSWFRKLGVRVRHVASSRIGMEVGISALHALDSHLALAKDAEITAALLQNLGPVLTAIQPQKEAVIRAGALLIVKVDDAVSVNQLTSAQQLVLDHMPDLVRSPREILKALGVPTQIAIEP
jgi:hypothetical protein